LKKKHIHLVGIAGISMSGIARALLIKGYNVSGSDLRENHLLDELKELGADIFTGHDKKNVHNADALVVSSAIPEDNPELRYAEQNNIKIYKRAEMIASMMEDKKGIAISGTHGKTTTTSMISLILREGKLDPTIFLGGELKAIGGNVYIGNGEYFVTEADESDGSLLYFNPEFVVVTNMELDHHDFYSSKQKLVDTFKEFINRVSKRGKAVLCSEDKALMNIVDKDDDRILTYGFNQGNIRARDIKLLPFGSYFDVYYTEKKLGSINLQIPGEYNILNALAAIAIGMFTGLSFTVIKRAIESFSGVHRRFEKKGLIDNILIIDDYAHHPTEIKETLKAAKNTGYERVIAIFQPHRYSRTLHLFDEFVKAFDRADHLIITSIYGAGETPIHGVDSKGLADAIAKRGTVDVDYIESVKDIPYYLKTIIRSKDLVITIGAGNVYEVGENLITDMNKYKEMA